MHTYQSIKPLSCVSEEDVISRWFSLEHEEDVDTLSERLNLLTD